VMAENDIRPLTPYRMIGRFLQYESNARRAVVVVYRQR